MLRSFATMFAVVLAVPGALAQTTARAPDRTLPMHFEWRQPVPTCGASCGALIFASGAVTADTPRTFKDFVKDRNLRGATLVLDSDGGSVLGAISFGRDIRQYGLVTTVGRMTDGAQAKILPDADCESMCVFVLLGGAQRFVPPQARVMVHQIWLGDRRNDPTAANYSAEDVSLVQRDIGSLAQYTADMGASIELLTLSLRIPPWERMHMLTSNEMRRVALDNEDRPADKQPATVAIAPSVVKVSAAPVISGIPTNAISEHAWTLVDRDSVTVLARHHPLTDEGTEIGSFDLAMSCAPNGAGYLVSYTERRRDAAQSVKLSAISLLVGTTSARLAVVSSRRDALDLVTVANGTLSAAALGGFAAAGSHSMVIETEGSETATAIRIGNTGAMHNLPLLAASCTKDAGKQARLAVKKTGGLAAAE